MKISKAIIESGKEILSLLVVVSVIGLMSLIFIAILCLLGFMLVIMFESLGIWALIILGSLFFAFIWLMATLEYMKRED